jgi:flagellar protein FlgJ
MGLAEMLVRQLTKVGAPMEAAPATAVDAGSAATTSIARPPTNVSETSGFPLREKFVEKMWPLAVAAGRSLGVDPKHVVAQAALETGWGRSPIGNNYFGIKGGTSWQGASTQAATREYVNGEAQVMSDKFRAYASAEESVRDYVRLLGSSPRYAAALGTGSDTAAFAEGLRAGGYATDPHYATKLQSVVQVVNGMLPAAIKTGTELPITPASTPP